MVIILMPTLRSRIAAQCLQPEQPLAGSADSWAAVTAGGTVPYSAVRRRSLTGTAGPNQRLFYGKNRVAPQGTSCSTVQKASRGEAINRSAGSRPMLPLVDNYQHAMNDSYARHSMHTY